MAPVTRYDDHLPAITLSLVKDASNDNTIDTSGSGGDISYAALHNLIFQLMSLVGKNQAIIAKANGQLQTDQSSIVQAQADSAAVQSKEVVKQVNDYLQQLADSAKWGILGSIFKWIAAAIVIVVGVLTSEFGIGLVLLSAVAIFMASPLFDMTVNALADGLVAAGCPKEWANLISQIIVIVIITVCTFGAGTASSAAGLAKAGSEVAQAGSKFATVTITAAKLALQVMLQALLSSSILPQLLAKCPGIDQIPALQAVLTVVISIIAAVVAGKIMMGSAASEGQSLTQTIFSKLGKSLDDLRTIEYTINSAGRVGRGIAIAGETGAGGGQAYYELQASGVLAVLAPLQSLMQLFGGFSSVMTHMSEQTQESTKDAAKTFQTLFRTKFYADMEATVKEYNG
jgi:2-methylisocitrate lyase-like PEP mutase family enzyme